MVKKNREALAATPSSEETDSDASSSSEEEERLLSTADKKFAAQKKPTEPSADEAMDSGSESDDSDFDTSVKPILSKSVNDGSKLKKPRSKPSNHVVSPTKTPTKRALALEGENDSKKVKKEKGEGGGTEEEGKKSALFQRLWSDDDEIAILKGMLEYKEKKGADPMADANDFHDFIKKSLHVDVDRRQVVDKVRRLRKRYENSVGKRKTFNPHEKNAFELSKRIWGKVGASADVDQQTKNNMKTRTVLKAATGLGSPSTMSTITRNEAVISSSGITDVENGLEKMVDSWQFIGKASISMGLDENIVKGGLGLCREDKKAEIEEKWMQLHLEESNLFSRKLDLARQEGMMIIEAFRSGRR